MIAGHPKLVRRLRQRVRATVRANPQLRRERRRLKTRATQNLTFHHLRFVVPLLVVGGVLSVGQAEQALPAMAWWTLAITFMRAGQFAQEFRTSPALWLFYHWPVTNAEVFDHQAHLALRRNVWLACDWLGFGIVAAVQHGGPSAWAGAVVFAVAQAVASGTFAAVLARTMPRVPFALIGSVMAVSLWIGGQLVKNSVGMSGATASVLRAVMGATPGGWLAWAQKEALAGAVGGWVIAVAITIAALVWLRIAGGAIRRCFTLESLFGYGNDDAPGSPAIPAQADTQGDMPETVAHDTAELPRLSADAASAQHAAQMRSARERLDEALCAPQGAALSNRGWLEACVVRCLTPRHRVVIDFLHPHGATWTRTWLLAFAFVAGAALLRIAGVTAEIVSWLPFAALAVYALPAFGSGWLGLAPVRTAGGQIGIHAFVPVGYFEVVGAVLFANLVRALFGFPLLVLAAKYGFASMPLPAADALSYGWRMLVVLIAIMPVGVVLAISKTTNDSSSRWWLGGAMLAVIIFGLIGGVAIGMVLFVAKSGLVVAGCVTTLLVVGYGATALYGWLWGRGTFDLVGKLPPS